MSTRGRREDWSLITINFPAIFQIHTSASDSKKNSFVCFVQLGPFIRSLIYYYLIFHLLLSYGASFLLLPPKLRLEPYSPILLVTNYKQILFHYLYSQALSIGYLLVTSHFDEYKR